MSLFEHLPSSPNQKIDLAPFGIENCELFIKREDLLHPHISGNKFRKLKYNLLEAIAQKHDALVAFGGAYSNHIAATAAAAKEVGIKSIGIIRGEELESKIESNPTLIFARNCGMELLFVSRERYKERDSAEFTSYLSKLPQRYYLLPEGGTNALAVEGCSEIISEAEREFDYICTAVGTGGTLAGIVNSSFNHQTILGFSALQGKFQSSLVKQFTSKSNFEILDAYCFGGYGKVNEQLISFLNNFKDRSGILLDPVYTGKMIFGILDLLKLGYFEENSRILAVHTGGLQGILGMNKLLEKKKLPLIE